MPLYRGSVFIRFRSLVGETWLLPLGTGLGLLLLDVDKSKACDWLLDCGVTDGGVFLSVCDWLEDSDGAVGSADGGKVLGYPYGIG